MAINDVTRDMLSLLPSWMDIQNENSVGAKFLNVQGNKIQELETYVKRELANLYIDDYVEIDNSGNLVYSKVNDLVDIIYKTPIIPEVLDITNLVIYGM
jgi:hypothetical protein